MLLRGLVILFAIFISNTTVTEVKSQSSLAYEQSRLEGVRNDLTNRWNEANRMWRVFHDCANRESRIGDYIQARACSNRASYQNQLASQLYDQIQEVNYRLDQIRQQLWSPGGSDGYTGSTGYDCNRQYPYGSRGYCHCTPSILGQPPSGC